MTDIRYAQCWEDPRVLQRALAVCEHDDIISIASGGDNTFALLLEGPRSVVAVDCNPAQVFLVELKGCAIKQLDYDDFVCFIGARPGRDRLKLYSYIRGALSSPARYYWDCRSNYLRRGIIHSGKFERYFALFRHVVLPLIHSRELVHKLLSRPPITTQKEWYSNTWDNWRWRVLFKVFFGKVLLSRLGRSHELFKYVGRQKIGETLLERARHGLAEIPLRGNFFLEYILSGGYADLDTVHPYLNQANFYCLREFLPGLRLVHAPLEEYLQTLAPGSIAKFNLSDIFEYMSAVDIEMTLQKILSVSRDGAKIAFWTLFVPQTVPVSLSRWLLPDDQNGLAMAEDDRGFFYERFHLWKIASCG